MLDPRDVLPRLDRRADGPAVHRHPAAGRDREVRAAGVRPRAARDAAAARRDLRRADAGRAGAAAGGPAIAHRLDQGLVAQPRAESRRRRRRPGPCGCRPTAWCCRSSSPRCSARGRGDVVTVEVLDGRRPVRQVPVAGIVEEYMGTSAYMEIDALRRLVREGDTLSGAFLKVDAAHDRRALRRLKDDAGGGRRRASSARRSRASRRRSPRVLRHDLLQPAVLGGHRVRRRLQRGAGRRCRSAAASWPACACSASRAARSRSSCSASWPS